MRPLIVLPTLDGSIEAAVARLDAWASAPARRRMAEVRGGRTETLGDIAQQSLLLDVGPR